MKNVILLIATLFSVVYYSYSQELVENKIDDFTNKAIKRTSWERLFYTNKGNVYFRISNIDNSYYFDFKYMDGSVFSVEKGAKLMFKLENDSIYTLENLEYGITGYGEGAIGFSGSLGMGIKLTYVSLDDTKFEILGNKKAKRLRFYTSKGYIEEDLKPQRAELIPNAIKLVR